MHVAELPDPTPHTVFAQWFHEALGGTSAGKALNLRRLGLDVTLSTLVGGDATGEQIVGALRAEGIAVIPRRSDNGSERVPRGVPRRGRLPLRQRRTAPRPRGVPARPGRRGEAARGVHAGRTRRHRAGTGSRRRAGSGRACAGGGRHQRRGGRVLRRLPPGSRARVAYGRVPRPGCQDRGGVRALTRPGWRGVTPRGGPARAAAGAANGSGTAPSDVRGAAPFGVTGRFRRRPTRRRR